MELKHQIAKQLYRAFEDLGADDELMAIIGSYADTLSDQEILDLLTEYNRS